MEKIDSDKIHVQSNICIHICVYVFSIRAVPTSLSISSLFLNKEILLWEQLVSTLDLMKSDGRHKASSDCKILHKKTSLEQQSYVTVRLGTMILIGQITK